jgi:hypothetical protein
MWKRRSESSKPSIRRVSGLALTILAQGAQEAATGPIERTHAHRLALAWLAYMEFALPAEADSFWNMLGRARSYTMDKDGCFRFDCDSKRLLAEWRREAGG